MLLLQYIQSYTFFFFKLISSDHDGVQNKQNPSTDQQQTNTHCSIMVVYIYTHTHTHTIILRQNEAERKEE